MSRILNREALLAAGQNRERRTVPLPQLDGAVMIQEVRADMIFETMGKEPRERSRILATESIIDEQGKPVYTAETVEEFFQLPHRIAETIMDAINDLNGWTPESREELEKNSESPSDDSASGSHDILA